MKDKDILSHKKQLQKAEQEYLVYINSIEDIKYNFDAELERKLASITAEDGLTEVTDKDIAKELGLSAQNYSTRLTKNRLPLKYIVDLCLSKNVNINWVLYSNQPLWKQEEATKAIQHYAECRANKYKRLLGKFSGRCEGFVKFARINQWDSVIGDRKDLPTSEIKYIKEDDIFGADYKKSRNWALIAWFIILFSFIYYLGYLHGANSKSIPAYEKEIEDLKIKYKFKKIINTVGSKSNY